MIYLINPNEITPNWTCPTFTCGGYDCDILACNRYKETDPCNFTSPCPPVSEPYNNGSLF